MFSSTLSRRLGLNSDRNFNGKITEICETLKKLYCEIKTSANKRIEAMLGPCVTDHDLHTKMFSKLFRRRSKEQAMKTKHFLFVFRSIALDCFVKLPSETSKKQYIL